jgi:SAM-dependent methyltransferase
MKGKRLAVVLGVVAAFVAAMAPGAWAVEASVPTSSQTQELGLVPYVPTPQEVVDTMIAMAGVTKKDVVFDLGCGDGRIVVAAAKKGARAYGVDIDAARVKEAREAIKKAGLEKKATIYLGDVFKTDISSATVVTMYLLPEYNNKLRPRLESMLPVGARVVSHDFDMDDWPPVEQKEVTEKNGRTHTVYFWKITAEMKKHAAGQPAAAEPAKEKEKELPKAPVGAGAK